jgi:hypothetical protein
MTLLSSLSAITLQGSSGSNNQLDQTFFSNADEMLWTKKNDDIRRREERERLWQVHVENVRKFREPEVRQRLESARKHREFNKKMREVMQKSTPQPKRRDASRDADFGASANARSDQPPLSQANIRSYFYSSSGAPILPEGLEFQSSVARPHPTRLVAAQATSTRGNKLPSGKTIGEEAMREDAWFASAKQRIRQDAT